MPFILRRLVQGHQALLQLKHVVIYLLAHLVLPTRSFLTFSSSWTRCIFTSIGKSPTPARHPETLRLVVELNLKSNYRRISLK